jgi:Txe/YoeB family toxin of Txe-Axe toxin-antitoxin module
MKTVFGKMQIKYFYQGYFNRDINSKKIIVYQLKTEQHQTSTQILLISCIYIQISS